MSRWPKNRTLTVRGFAGLSKRDKAKVRAWLDLHDVLNSVLIEEDGDEWIVTVHAHRPPRIVDGKIVTETRIIPAGPRWRNR